MITLNNITLRRGPNILLKNVNWTIYHKQHIGIIGPNGAGKSSLFAMLLGKLDADLGELFIPTQLKLAHVAQETPSYQQSAIDFVLDGDVELRKLEQALLEAEEKDDGMLIAKLHVRLSEIDSYTANSRAAQLLSGLGFTAQEQTKSVNEFSGGWRVRLNLAQALMSRSDMLLLDEPTNHLDLDAVMWLETWLKKYPGTLLLISHDREFLDGIVDHIAHVHQQELKLYSGNYSSFEKQRAEHILLQQAAYEKQQKYIAHLQSFVDRFKAKASKAKQAQSRIKAIERLDLIDLVHEDQAIQFHFKEPTKCPNPLITLQDVVVAYDDNIILTDINLSISPKDRIAFLGPNGAGKTSLIKCLAGELKEKQGERCAGAGLKIGYFAQHQVDTLQLDETPLYHLKEIAPQHHERELRTYLGTFDFVGSKVLEPVKTFSGGEKSRLALALLIWQRPNLLLLDEPTNHLDLDMRQALSLALQEYQGAIILVSHDRFLINTTVDQLMLIAHGKLDRFDGDLNDYQKWLLEFRRQTAPAKEKKSPEPILQPDRNKLIQQVKKLEEELAKHEKEAAAIELQLADTTIYQDSNKEKLTLLLARQQELQKLLATTEAAWLEAYKKMEQSS